MSCKPIFLLVLVIFSSCVSSNRVIKSLPPNSVAVAKSNNSFEGRFSNAYTIIKKNKATLIPPKLSQILSHVENTKLNWTPYSDSAIVYMKFEGNTLFVKISEDSMPTQTFKLKAKIEGNYLSIKRKWYIVPIPFLFLTYNHKIFLALDHNGDLIAKYGYAHGGWFLIFANGMGEDLSMKYDSVSN